MHEPEAYLLPQFVGLNTSGLLDVQCVSGLLCEVLAYECVQLDGLIDFVLTCTCTDNMCVHPCITCPGVIDHAVHPMSARACTPAHPLLTWHAPGEQKLGLGMPIDAHRGKSSLGWC